MSSDYKTTGRCRILRGIALPQTQIKLPLSDGNYRHGWIVKEFQVRVRQPMIPTEYCNAILTIDSSATSSRPWDFESGQIAWAACGNAGGIDGGTHTGAALVVSSLVDSDIIITEDLYLLGDVFGDDPDFNYWIKIEEVTMNANEGLYAQARLSQLEP